MMGGKSTKGGMMGGKSSKDGQKIGGMGDNTVNGGMMNTKKEYYVICKFDKNGKCNGFEDYLTKVNFEEIQDELLQALDQASDLYLN